MAKNWAESFRFYEAERCAGDSFNFNIDRTLLIHAHNELLTIVAVASTIHSFARENPRLRRSLSSSQLS